MANLQLTYEELERIVVDDWYNGRLKLVRTKGPLKDGACCECTFKDTETGKNYSFYYLYYECGVHFPGCFEQMPEGIDIVDASVLVQWLAPGAFAARKDCTPKQKADMDLWETYKAKEKSASFYSCEGYAAEVEDKLAPMKDELMRFMSTKEAMDMANVRAVLLPLAMEHGFHQENVWRCIQRWRGHWY